MTKSVLWAPLGAVAALGAAGPPDPPSSACERRLHQAAHAQGVAVQPGERVVSDRQGRLRRDLSTGEVRLYYLVDRRIGGCPVPVVSPLRFEEANRAVGREVDGDRRER